MDRPVVLLVDDEPRILQALRRVLRHQGYRLLLADGGAAALEILDRESVDLVVSDYRMPEMNGAELLARIHSDYPRVRRMMLTGFSSLTDAEDILAKGAAEQLLMKPWDAEELRAAIRALIDKDAG